MCTHSTSQDTVRVSGRCTEAVTYRSDIQFHFPSSVFKMYHTNLSIMTFDRRYYSGALSKAVTEHSGLMRYDVALVLKRCQTFRGTRRIHTQWIKIHEDRCLRCQNSTDRNSRFTPLTNRQTRQPSSRTSLKPNFMCGQSDTAIVSGPARTHTYTPSAHQITPFDRTRSTIRTLSVTSH
jgi:hypothetical protein